jgi:hypothetical protein
MGERLVMVDKDKLRGLRDTLRDYTELQAASKTPAGAWQMILALANVLDALLSEIANGDEIGP